MDATITIQLNGLQQKLQQLLKQYKLLQKENEQLKKEVSTLKLKNTTNHTIVVDSLDVSTVADLQKNSTNKVALQKQIDKHLLEIDQCLLLLNAGI
jgi:regulator of replication initiation timing